MTAAFAQVNTRGPAWMSVDEARRLADPDLRRRAWDVRAALTELLPTAQLDARLALHVVKGAEPSPFARTDAAYPSIRGGHRGLFAHTLEGPKATALTELAGLWQAKLGQPAPFDGFDPARQALLAVRTTGYDRDALILSAVDRRTGEVGAPTALEMGGVTFFIGEADFERLVGPKATFGATAYDFASIDYRAVIDRVLDGSRSLALGNPYAPLPAAQEAALRGAADAAVAAAGLAGLTVVMSPPVVAAQEALPGNVLTHAQAITAALAVFVNDTDNGSSPLSIEREKVLNESGGAALDAAGEALARQRLLDHLRAPDTRLRALDLDEEPEGGPGPEARRVIQLDIPGQSGHVHWALLDRAGVAPPELISFN